ncbi:hypothetical protein ABH935_008374 [Catenulispora sp. GAS73]
MANGTDRWTAAGDALMPVLAAHPVEVDKPQHHRTHFGVTS